MSKILRKTDFLEGVITENGKIICDGCKRIMKLGEDTYNEGSNIDYDLCKKCYGEIK